MRHLHAPSLVKEKGEGRAVQEERNRQTGLEQGHQPETGPAGGFVLLVASRKRKWYTEAHEHEALCGLSPGRYEFAALPHNGAGG